jgi:hypothetical protein
MTEPKNKIDQLVMAVLQAVDERLELIRGQFGQLVQAADKHTAALAAWQQVIEHQQAELALRHAELDMKLADLAHASKRADREAPAHTAAAVAASAAAPAPAEDSVSTATTMQVAAPLVDTPPARPALVLEPLAPLATPATPLTPLASASPAAPSAPEAGAPQAQPAATGSAGEVDFAELAKLVEQQLDSWSGAA